jgi:cyclopropane fatty-acyl-phospholipid synthase-like methyltransferase
MKTQNTKLLEIGCARSAWLPYFAKEFGFKVYGVDYSELGCEQALQILSNEGMEGEIVCSDFFSPPESMIGQFDVVVSFGVLEHFQDAQGCILAFSKYLKRNGIMITNIPTLLEAHQKSGLELVSCNYFLSANFGVVNFENQRGNVIYEWILQSFCWLNRVIWFFENLIPVNPSRWCSPYINCVAMKS